MNISGAENEGAPDQGARSLPEARRESNRIEAGDYGECRECGEDINPGRLEIDPTALCCIECAAAR